MLLACTCGRMFRVPDGAPPVRRDCPVCGAILRDASTGIAQEDLRVLKEKERALRDAVRQRDRQLRQAQVQIQTLKSEVDKLRAGTPGDAPAQKELDILRYESGQRIRILEERVRALERELSRGGTPVRKPASDVLPVLAAPIRVEKSTDWKPLELPSDRLELALGSGVDEGALGDVPKLPSDRVPLFEEIPFLPEQPAPPPAPPPPAPDPEPEPVTVESAPERGFFSRMFKRRG